LPGKEDYGQKGISAAVGVEGQRKKVGGKRAVKKAMLLYQSTK
jgi:hypothetical protein